MQERMYKKPLCDTSELKQHLIDTWTSVSSTKLSVNRDSGKRHQIC